MSFGRKTFLQGLVAVPALALLPQATKASPETFTKPKPVVHNEEFLVYVNNPYLYTFSNLDVLFSKQSVTRDYLNGLIESKHKADLYGLIRRTKRSIKIDAVYLCDDCSLVPRYSPISLAYMFYADTCTCYKCNKVLKNRPLDRNTDCSLRILRLEAS